MTAARDRLVASFRVLEGLWSGCAVGKYFRLRGRIDIARANQKQLFT